MNEINVVPYIDVMLVLLVIFMVTAPMIQPGSVDLPSVGKSSLPPAAPLEVIIKADTSLALRDRSKGGAEQVVAGDKSVRYEAVLGVMDELQRQQVPRIGLLVQPVAADGK